jgi:hypothetical protein
MSTEPDPSELPALLSDEVCEIGRRDPDGVQDADMRQLALVAQPVHGRRAYAETFSDLANREQRWHRSPLW